MQYDLKQLEKHAPVLNKYRDDLKPELIETLDHLDIYINRELFNESKLDKFKVVDGVYSLTLYAKHLGMSVKSLAQKARDLGYNVVVDRNRKYDKRRYHTCLVKN